MQKKTALAALSPTPFNSGLRVEALPPWGQQRVLRREGSAEVADAAHRCGVPEREEDSALASGLPPAEARKLAPGVSLHATIESGPSLGKRGVLLKGPTGLCTLVGSDPLSRTPGPPLPWSLAQSKMQRLLCALWNSPEICRKQLPVDDS